MKLHLSTPTQGLHKYLSSEGPILKPTFCWSTGFSSQYDGKTKNYKKIKDKIINCACVCAHTCTLIWACVCGVSFTFFSSAFSLSNATSARISVYHRTATSSSHSNTFTLSLYWMLTIDGLHETLSSWSALFEKHLYKCQKVHRISFYFCLFCPDLTLGFSLTGGFDQN